MPTPVVKPVVWLGDSLRRLKAFPSTVQDEMGFALYLAQRGEKHPTPKPDIELITQRLKRAAEISRERE